MNNVKIVGTTHLDSREKIEQIIKEERPDIIGVELCRTRFDILVQGEKKGMAEDTSLIGKISTEIKKKAEEEHLDFGSDMVSACKIAMERKIPIILVDRDINEVRALMEKIPQNELIGFTNELVKFQTEDIKNTVKNINPKEVIKELKNNFPVAYEFLITSREIYILNKIMKFMIEYPKKRLLVFIGKGHEDNIKKQLEDL